MPEEKEAAATLSDLKLARRNLEFKILEILNHFEKTYGVTVNGVNVERDRHAMLLMGRETRNPILAVSLGVVL
jgi:hypothetical protein